jgi:hypothetical protein
MRKNVTICFRTNENLRKTLEKVAKADKLSLSTVIESFIARSLEERKEQKAIEKEKRRYVRKQIAAPVFISESGSETKDYRTGIIIDISLGGLRISVPKDHTFDIHIDEKTADFDTFFALPNEMRPVNVKCKPQNVFHANGDTQIGASFVDADFNSYQTIRDYVV